MYNVLAIQYQPVGKVIIRGREEDIFRVYWKKIGTAKNMADAKKKYGKVLKNPVLEEIR